MEFGREGRYVTNVRNSFHAKTTGKGRKNVIFRNVIIVVLFVFTVGLFIIGSAAIITIAAYLRKCPLT